MHVIARKALVDFWGLHPDSKSSLEAWYHEAKAAHWSSSAAIKQQYGSASIIGSERVVFDICGNKYRLVVRVNYGSGTVFVRFVGTHRQYDAIDVGAV